MMEMIDEAALYMHHDHCQACQVHAVSEYDTLRVKAGQVHFTIIYEQELCNTRRLNRGQGLCHV